MTPEGQPPRSRKPDAVDRARNRVVLAADEAARTRAEAQWCNGYRAKGGDTPQMQEKESRWWSLHSEAEKKFERSLTTLIRTARKSR